MWRFLKPKLNTSSKENEQVEELRNKVDEEVRKIVPRRKHSKKHYSPELKAQIGRHAAENGNAASCRKFNIPESTVRGFKTKYLAKLKNAGPLSSPDRIKRIDHATLGRPLKLGSLDREVWSTLNIHLYGTCLLASLY